jgi:nitroreductase
MIKSDDNPALDCIFGRRSIRKYIDQPVEEEKITSLLKAAMAAPSAVGKDPWRFVLVREKKNLRSLSEGLPNGRFIAAAALGIVVCGDRHAAHGGLEGYMVQDCTAALENMLIAAHQLGLGTCWLGVYPREERQRHVADVLKLPRGIEPLAAVAVGYPAEERPPRTRYNESFVHYETW